MTKHVGLAALLLVLCGAGAWAEAPLPVSPGSQACVAVAAEGVAESPDPSVVGSTQVSVDGGVVATSFTGDGSTLTALDPAALSAGTAAINITGNAAGATSAATATALAADGGNCAADQATAGVDASGNAQECRDQADLTAFGDQNTRVGSGALASNTTGGANTAVGYNALLLNTTGRSNVALGWGALFTNDGNPGEGSLNVALGNYALYLNSTGRANTASGFSSLEWNSTGNGNVANGDGALYLNTTGSLNTGLGSQALRNNTTGSRNVAVGQTAGENASTGSDNVFIANEGVAGEANTIRIGGTAVGTDPGEQNRTFINGIFGVFPPLGPLQVYVDLNGQLGTLPSSLRYKEEIRDMGSVSERLLDLRPVTFRFKQEAADGERPIQFGLIAEEVAEVFPELVVYDAEGRPETVKYHLLSTVLLNELQKQERLNEAQAAELARLRVLRGRVEALEARVAALADRRAVP